MTTVKKPRRAAKLEKPYSIAELAKLIERPHRTLARQLVQLHKRDVELGEGADWLVRLGTRKWFVNLSRLRRAHPALTESWYVERDEFGDLSEQVKRFRAATQELGKRERSTASRLTQATEKLAALERMVADLTSRLGVLERKATARSTTK